MLTFIIDSLKGASLTDLMRGFEQERLVIPVIDLASQAIKLGVEAVGLGLKVIEEIAVLL